jgi:hypothetical protein
MVPVGVPKLELVTNANWLLPQQAQLIAVVLVVELVLVVVVVLVLVVVGGGMMPFLIAVSQSWRCVWMVANGA